LVSITSNDIELEEETEEKKKEKEEKTKDYKSLLDLAKTII
jgi:HSP90 family molecular chaperone